MSRETERFNRALQKFINDNPDVDINNIKEEFLQMYNSGEYRLLDDFERANDLFLEAHEASDIEEAKSLLEKAVEITPKHFDARTELLLLKEGLSYNDFEELLKEIKNDLVNDGVDFDNIEESLWYNIDCRPYIRCLNKYMLFSRLNKDYDKAIDIALEMIRLDENSKLEQDLQLLCTYLCKKDYHSVLEHFNNIDDNLPAHYLLVKLMALVGVKNYIDADNISRALNKANPYYLPILTGFLDIEEEEFHKMLDSLAYLPGSIEECVLYLNLLNEIFEPNTEAFVTYFNTRVDIVKELIMPNDNAIPILMYLSMTESDSKIIIINQLLGIGKEKSPLYGVLKEKYTKDELNQVFDSLVERKHIEKTEKNRYQISFLGYSLMSFMASMMDQGE